MSRAVALFVIRVATQNADRGGEIMLEFVDVSIMVLVTIAIINRVKKEAPKLKSYVYTLMAFAVGAGVYCLFTYAPDPIPVIFTLGLAASGIYDVYKKQ